MAYTGQLRFYYRNGCHLCEEMAAVLHQGWPDVFAQLHWIDVDADSALQEQYGSLVPVLDVNGETLCHYFADTDKLSLCFGQPVNPV